MHERHVRRLLTACGAIAGMLLVGEPAVFGQAPVPAAQAAQSSALPSASQIVKKYIAAIGGEAEFKKVNSIHATGTVEIVAQNLSGKVEMVSARPNRMLVRGELSGVGKFETGYDGKIGWEIDPVTGPKVLTGRRLLEVADDSRFDSVLHAADHVKSMTVLAKTTFDRREAYQVQVVFVSGSDEVEYFDVETGLLLGSEAKRELMVGVLPTIAFMRDYKKFGGIMQPTTLASRTMGIEQQLRMTSFEYNAVPANAFALPQQIKALLGK